MKNRVVHIIKGSTLFPLAQQIPPSAQVLVLVRLADGSDRTYERGFAANEALAAAQGYVAYMAPHPDEYDAPFVPTRAEVVPEVVPPVVEENAAD